MKTRSFVPSRALAAIVAAILASPTIAGDVTVSRVDLATGDLKPVTTGALTHAPAYFFPDSSKPLLADACGALYEIKTDVYGEKTLQGPIDDDRSLAQVRLLAQDKYGAVGIGLDGKSRSIDPTYQHQDMVFDVSRGGDSPLDLGKTRLFVAGTGDFPHLAFFDDGRLLGAYNLKGGTPAARFIAPRNGWSNIRHAISTYIGLGRSRRIVMITIDDAGQMMIHEPVEESEGFESYVTSTQGKPLGTNKFTSTKGLFAHSGDIAYRWTESGDLFAVDLNKGTEKQLGGPGSFKGAFMAKPDGELYLVKTSGSFSSCPVAKEVIVVEKPKDTSIIAAADEIKALSDAHYKIIDDTAREPIPSFDGEFSDNEAAIRALFEKINGFENTVVKPVREKVDAFVEKYGDEDAATIKLREVTDDLWYLNSRLNWLQDAIKRWDGVRPAIADSLAHQASIQFLLGEHSVDWSVRSKQYLRAKPWAEWALQFNPDHAEARKMLAAADGNAASADEAYKKRIQNAVWPKDVEVAGDAAAMKAKLLKYFQKHHSGKDFENGSRYFAIRLDHDWYVNQTNILDQPTQWRISVYLASTIPGDPEHARVIWAEVGTQTGDKNSPFDKRYFGMDPYLIPIERVPADDEDALQESLKLIAK